jgi:hypothetical protein
MKPCASCVAFPESGPLFHVEIEWGSLKPMHQLRMTNILMIPPLDLMPGRLKALKHLICPSAPHLHRS